MIEITGWLLDLYEHPERGLALWWIAEDGRRLCLYQRFPADFYAAGNAERLAALHNWLEALPRPPTLSYQERRDLFLPDPLTVLAIQVARPAELPVLFRQAEQSFPDLTYYDADLQVQLRHAAAFQTFPLVRCRLEVDDQGEILGLQALDTPWELDPEPPPLRILEISLDSDPHHHLPTQVEARYQSQVYRFPLRKGSDPAYWVKTLLQRHDPDILLTDFGDTWLLDYLLESVHNSSEKLPLSRDPARLPNRIRERTYFSYGQIIYRGQQVHLFGRLHIDRHNAMMWKDYGLEGVLETARLTALPIQTAARVSPGTGISSMEITTALRSKVLVPWHKQQAEEPKTALELIHADSGGLIYQPTVGLHRDVAELDFASMYPSIMVRCNISPEKKPVSLDDPLPAEPGLVPRTLAPLLEKRLALKHHLLELPAWDPRRHTFQVRASAEKWLLVVCFGYLGYRNARFGRIESHEAVTSGGREALLRAKEAAEALGFEILHLYVDGLWIKQAGYNRPPQFDALLEEIHQRTGLHIALEGIYRWVAFLPSRLDERVPVGNRYFGVFQDGTIKLRGLEARRRDTPAWVARVQTGLVEHLAQAPDADRLKDYLPSALALLRRAVNDLKAHRVPLEELLVSQRLSRELSKYRDPSPAARAALQLQVVGKTVSPGQRVRFLLMRGQPGVHAWDLPEEPDPRRLDLAAYTRWLLRAAETVLQPLGIDSGLLKGWLQGGMERRML